SHILKKGNRKNFFMAITPEQHQETIATAASMFDAGATVLHLMGFEAKMGFGRSMLNQQAGLLSSLPGFAGALNDWRNSIQSFWGFPVLADKDEIIIDVEKRILTVNDQRYYLPLIMEVGKNKQTQFRFPISNSNEKNGLAVHLVKLAKDRTFLWVDKCSAINTISKPSDAEKYCMLYGQLGGKRVQEELKQSRVIPAQLLTGGQLSQTASHIQ
ncbi:MAG: hypothetical protein OEY38_22265, partial [Gammaproteobacteria bacterium]|nr:hypothetical protein [Gammaproteobacteria bacterium]